MSCKPSKPKSRRRPKRAPYPKSWHIILIDQEPLRRTARAECKKLMARLEKARAQWNGFEKEDKPAYGRWLAQEFGSLLSAVREIEDQIREKEMLIDEVEIEMRFGGRSGRSAYERVIYKRTHPSAEPGDFEDPEIGGDSPAGADDVSDFEKEALFQDWLREFLGVNPDKLDDRSYWSTFDAFSFHMFGSGGKTPPKPAPRPAVRPDAPEKTVGSRLKELYRLLVRRLHPDTRADGEAEVSSLWHEVQEAYAAGNIERLETLLALSDIETDKFAAQTTLFQMSAVLKELKTALRNLQRSLRAAREDDAWDFATRGGGRTLRLRIAQELELELATRTDQLNRLNQSIATLSKPPPKVTRRRKHHEEHPRFAF